MTIPTLEPEKIREYPDDIMQTARAIGGARYVGPEWCHMRSHFFAGMYDNDPCVVSAAEALLAEREKRGVEA